MSLPLRQLSLALAGISIVAIPVAASLSALDREVASSDPRPEAEVADGTALPPIPTVRRPIVLVTVDTTRADHLSPYGAEDVETPVMAQLARDGVLFERAWSVAPITLVAHTSILTGRNPFEHGVRNNGTQYVTDEVTTLAESLKQHGYDTGAFVSAAVLDASYGLAQGFDVYDDDLSERRNINPRLVADRPAENVVAAATRWLDGLEGDAPYFLWVHFYDPHASYSPPPPYRDDYRERLYDGEIAYMDAQLGRLLAHPRIRAQGDDAPLVAVIGDHGESLGEHGERTHAILAYDATLRVPFFLRVPGGPRNRRVREPVGQVDLAPTLLSLVGAEGSEEIEGRDLTGLITGREREPRRLYYSETFLPFYTYGWAKIRTVHRGRWKLIDAPVRELYDLIHDPSELVDLREVERGIAHDLGRDLDAWLARVDDADRESSMALDPEQAAQLAALGYVSIGTGTVTDGERPNPMTMIAQHVGLERARALLGDRLYDAAERQLRSVLEHDPNNLAAVLDLAAAQEGAGRLDDAIATGERALALDPDYARIYVDQSRREAHRGRVEPALALARMAEERNPNDVSGALQVATLLYRLGRRSEGERALRALLARAPDDVRVNTVFAQSVELAAGRVEEATTRLERAVARDPYYAPARLLLGATYERLGRTEDASASYRAGLRSGRDHSGLHGALGQLLAREGDHDGAAAHLREAIRLAPTPRSEFHVALGAVYAETGRQAAAEQEYRRALAVDPTHPGARNNAAIALYRSGRLDDARRALLALVEEHPRLADAHNNLAAIAVETRAWRDAIRHARRTLELDPAMVQAHNNLGIGLHKTGALGEARRAFERALALDTRYWPARFNLGLLLRDQRDAEGAATAWRAVLEQVPAHAETHYELGALCADALGEPQRARAHWNAFLRHAADDPRVDEVRRRLAAL